MILCILVTAGNTSCEEGLVRVVDGFDPSNGRVEYCRHRMWSAVCSEGWDNNDATVVCRQLGYNPSGMPENIKFHFQCLTCIAKELGMFLQHTVNID